MAGLFGSMANVARNAFGSTPGGLSGSDKLMLLGATLSDLGNDDASNLFAAQKLIGDRRQLAAKQAFGKKLGGLIGGQAAASQGDVLAGGTGGFMPQLPPPEDPTMTAIKNNPAITGINPGAGGPSAAPAAQPRLNANSPELAQIVLEARNAGYDIDDVLEVLKMQQPSVQYDRGYGYDSKTGKSVGPFHTELDKGQEPLFDSSGRIAYIRNVDGSVKSAAEMAGAVEGAKEAAKAGYDLVAVPQSDGSTVMMPRSQAVAMLGGGVGPSGGARAPAATLRPAPSAAGPRVGVSQSPASAAADKMIAEAGAKAGLDLPKLTDQANLTFSVIDQIRRHPSLGDRTGNSAYLPALRPQDRDFDNLVSQVKGGAFLEAINSLRSTGQITEIEGKKATDALLRAQQNQSQEGFLKALADYEGVVRAGMDRAQRAASGGQRSGSAPPSRDAVAAEMRRRGLIR